MPAVVDRICEQKVTETTHIRLKACSTCMTILVTRNRRTCELTSYAESTCSSSDETHRNRRETRQRNTEKTRRNIASFDLSELLSFTEDYWRIYRPMGAVWFGVLLFLIVISQASALETAEEPLCIPGFKSDKLILKMVTRTLRPYSRLGKVSFSDCKDRTTSPFISSDSRVEVQLNGTLKVRRLISLYEGHLDFFVKTWDSQGRILSLPVTLLYHGHHHDNNKQKRLHGERQHHNHQQHLTEVDSADNTESLSDPEVPVLHFPKVVQGLRRKKRDWVIPDLSVVENDRGPYPLRVSQIRSSEDKIKKIYYSITGPGADEEPQGLFSMDKDSGMLYLTQPLDREVQDRYTFQAHAVADGSGNAEQPMDIVVNVIDQNDNKPTFEKDTFLGEVPEASPKNFDVIKVVAIDLDQPNTDNSDIRYKIISQDPVLPSDKLFVINPVTGAIRVDAVGLDREKYPKYTLVVQAADMMGNGLTGEAKVILTVTDSNDNAPAYVKPTYEATVAENKVDIYVTTLSVTDGDEPHSPAWNAKFTIVSGDAGGYFTVKTGTNKHEGIISTAKGLDFEKSGKHTLLVAVENEVPFATALPTATATVVVTVLDVNEAPVFNPIEKLVSKPEDLAVGSDVVQYIASDPDTARKQKVMYRIIADPAGWLNVDKDTGLISVRTLMDRESSLVKDDKYTALIGAYDNDDIPATGTGTLIIQLQDVNDNPPTIKERAIRVCNKESAPQLLSVTDKDGPGYTSPYSVSLQGTSRTNWTARMNDSKTGIVLNLATKLASGLYTVVLRVSDSQGLEQDSTVQATVCDCTGEDVLCLVNRAGGPDLPVVLGILGGILLLLMLVLLLLLFARRRRGEKKEPLLQDNDVRDNIYYYDEEGGGEDDQDYDLSVLHRGLDNRPEVFRNDVVPNFMPAPQYRPRPANPEEIGNFIDHNLKAADNDPTAPPYDSLLVFDYEGGGSDSGSLSSLNSSSSGDQDYDCLNEWGPRFKKLADMYGGGEDML